MTPMTSLWRDSSQHTSHFVRPEITTDPFASDRRYDVVVAGAGLTGLTTALMCVQAGMSVAVIDARAVGAVTSGNTTAKVSLLQGTQLSTILRHTSLRNGRAYVDSNRAGMDWLLRYCDEHQIPVQRRDAYSYAGTESGRRAVEREVRAANRLGLNVTMADASELPFPSFGAARLVDQAQVNPMDVLATLAADIRSQGGVIHENTRLLGAHAAEPVEVRTNRGMLRADRLVLATGVPVLDRGLYFAKVVPQRSYALAFRVPGEVPDGMYLSVDSPARSLRTVPIDGETRLVVGGNGHTVGRSRSPLAAVRDLENWTAQHFPGAERTHAWSAQDYQSASRIPFVGWLPRGRGRIFLATGFNKWGMCNAVAASLSLVADFAGTDLPWARILHRRVTTPSDVASALGANAAVVRELVAGYVRAWNTVAAEPAEGQGVVSHDGIRPVATCRVNGVTSTVSARCPHLGGVVAWNDAELSWDCPLHGSRFSSAGEVLEGPATTGLPSR